MTKADIVENVYEKVGGFSKKEAAEIVETVFDAIKETLDILRAHLFNWKIWPDFTQIPDADRPYETVDAYVSPLVPGSYLAISHPASDVDAEAAAQAAREYDNSLPTTQTNRNRAQVTKFFDGLELLPPGVVQLNKWRPNPDDEDPGIEISSWAGLGLKH